MVYPERLEYSMRKLDDVSAPMMDEASVYFGKISARMKNIVCS